MLPSVILFGREWPMYGLMAALGTVLGLALAVPRSPRYGLGRRESALLYLWGGVGALLGAKALYLLTVLPELVRDLEAMKGDGAALAARYLFSGFVFYGGLLGAVGGAALGAKLAGVRLGDHLPALVPAVPLVHVVGRVGCFCAGCCYGIPAEWGVAFTRSLMAPNGVKLVPVQLMEGAFALALCVVTALYARRRPGGWRVLGLYLTCYAPARFGLEFLRGDEGRGALWGLSTSQWLSVAALGVGIWLMARRKDRGS